MLEAEQEKKKRYDDDLLKNNSSLAEGLHDMEEGEKGEEEEEG